MKIKGYEFSIREFGGSLGDFGTFLSLLIGYIVVVGMDPASMLIMFGISNIVLGFIYNLPVPLQPKKVVAAVAISNRWTSGMVQGAGIGLGITWFIFIFTGLIDKIVKYTPKSVIRGIQIALGITLMKSGFFMIKDDSFIIGIIAIVVIFLFIKNEKLPPSLILLLLGIIIMVFKNQVRDIIVISLSLPKFSMPNITDIFKGYIYGGIAQIPLTLSNAVIATSALFKDYFPYKVGKKITEKKLLANMGIMNITVPLFGGMPQCHGAGGLAGQYTFGARTGGSGIMEGIIEVFLGLFLATSIKDIFNIYPMSIVGAMMIFVGIQLGKFTTKVEKKYFFSFITTTVISVIFNMAFGFLGGIIVYYILEKRIIYRNIM